MKNSTVLFYSNLHAAEQKLFWQLLFAMIFSLAVHYALLTGFLFVHDIIGPQNTTPQSLLEQIYFIDLTNHSLRIFLFAMFPLFLTTWFLLQTGRGGYSSFALLAIVLSIITHYKASTYALQVQTPTGSASISGLIVVVLIFLITFTAFWLFLRFIHPELFRHPRITL